MQAPVYSSTVTVLIHLEVRHTYNKVSAGVRMMPCLTLYDIPVEF